MDLRQHVFIVQRPNRHIDLSPAGEYGEVLVLLGPDDQITHHTAPIVRKLRRALSNFNGETDRLVCVGDPVAIGVATAIVAEKTGGRYRTLKWDRMLNDNRGGYWDVAVDLNVGDEEQ